MKNNNLLPFKQLMSDSKFYMDYSRWKEAENNSEGKLEWTSVIKSKASETFGGDVHKACNFMKDIYNARRWNEIVNNYLPVDLTVAKKSQTYTAVDTLGAAACSGGKCEI